MDKTKLEKLRELREQKQKFGIVNIKQKKNEAVAFLLIYTDPSLPSNNERLQETVANLENILLNNFSRLYDKNNWELPQDARKELDELSSDIKDKGVNLEKCQFFRKKDEQIFGIYIHNNKKFGALVISEGGDEEIAHELALQIVANKPQFLSLDSIPQEIQDKEKQKYLTQAQEEKPPKKPEIIQKIVQGKLNKYFTNACFLEQPNFRDPETKIKDYLKENQAQIKEFYLLEV